MKTLSASRLKGIGSFTFAALAYSNLSTLSLMLGPTLPMISIVGAAMVGARALNEQGLISKIEYLTEGEFKNQIRVTVNASPFSSKTCIMNPKDTMSLCALGADDMGGDDLEGNILHAKYYIDETSGKILNNGLFRVPADAFRDKITMEWIMAVKNESSETDASFNELIIKRHKALASTGGLTGLQKYNAESTGFANFGDEEELSEYLKKNPEHVDDTLKAMSKQYGQENLEKMRPTEFYRLYRDYSLGRL